MTSFLRDLFTSTVRTPAEAAQSVLGISVSRTLIFQALAAGAAMNALITGGSMVLFPLPPEWPSFIMQPLIYFVIVAGGLYLFAHMLTWVGRGMGGQGTLDDMLKLMIWLQFVRIALQVIGLFLMVALPLVGSFYYLAVTVLSIWIVLHFIKAGHQLGSLGTAMVVLFITIVGLVLGLTLLLTLVGVGSLGGVGNV